MTTPSQPLGQFETPKVLTALRALLKILPADAQPDQNGKDTKVLRRAIEEAITRLNYLEQALDPIKRPEHVFDPSDPKRMGELIGSTMLSLPRHPLGSVERFYGAGVYALFYRGEFAAYEPIRNRQTPIYVGKADPPTPDAKDMFAQGTKLHGRLSEHAKSIRAVAPNLKIEDFDCRYLVVQSGWQRSAEDYLLHRFNPIWNKAICTGFGKHGDNPATRGNTRSPWDTLHPGRKWATKDGNKPGLKSVEAITEEIARHYQKHPPTD